jgi:hypothetical protein
MLGRPAMVQSEAHPVAYLAHGRSDPTDDRKGSDTLELNAPCPLSARGSDGLGHHDRCRCLRRSSDPALHAAQSESVGAESEMQVGPRKEVLPRVRSNGANDHVRAVLAELGRGFTMRGGPAPTLAT